MAFLIKQHDLRPNLPFQLFMPDGTTPLDLSTATSVSIVMRKQGTTLLLLKDECDITDAVTGVGFYDWTTGDTDTTGQMEYEFEILWNNGDPQTVPADSYFALTITPDIG